MEQHAVVRYCVVVFLAILVSVAVWGIPVDAPDPPPYNILLVTPDQLSAEFMHTYGYPFPDTPNIDQLAHEGTSFARAYSAGPWTTPSFTAIHTGLYPTVHGMTLPPYHGACGPEITNPLVEGKVPPIPDYVNLSPHKPVLAEILKAHGMVTAADNANPWSFFHLANRGWDSFKFLSMPMGWPNGVPEFRNLPDPGHPDRNDRFYLTAPQTLPWAQQWLASHRGDRFFLWVHFMEPHEPFNPPPEYDRFKTAADYPELNGDNAPDVKKLQSFAKIGDTRAILRLDQLYAGKILYLDHYLGELMKTVHDLGLDGNTIIVLVSDHGELMYSHPQDYNTENHRSLYDANVHVPLILRGPQIQAGRRVDALVSQYDLVPTLLDLEGISPPSHFDGTSLKGILSGSASRAHEYVYSEQTDLQTQYSVRDERYKLIETIQSGKTQCFDHLLDPNEQKDICSEIPLKASDLKRALDLHIQGMIQEAKSYPDWENNLGLAVLEQRASKGLLTLTPRNNIAIPGPEPAFQLQGPGWSIGTGSEECFGLAFWSPPGAATASVIWRSYVPLIGEYEVSVCSGGTGGSDVKLATNANYIVNFGRGTLSFPVDQNINAGHWNVLGRFSDPISVQLTNQADGPIVAGAVRFRRLTQD